MEMEKTPKEVAEYLNNGRKKAVSVKAISPYVISVEFEDGQIRESDLSADLYGELQNLRKWDVFKTVYLDDKNAIAWDTATGHVDMCKDYLYIYGEQLNGKPGE